MAELGASQPALPEVPLQWVDFMWSLEKLRHKPYGKKLRERDWFRINPLEMVLLGAHSIASNTPAKRDHGTMVLVMCPLRGEMGQKPRYWQRLFAVLCATLQGAHLPAVVLQRCCSVLMSVWDCVREFPEFQPGSHAWCLRHIELSQVLQQLLTEQGKSLGVTLSLDLQTFLSSLERELAAASEKCGVLISEEEEEEEEEGGSGGVVVGRENVGEGRELASLLGSLLKQYSSLATVSPALELQVLMMLQTSGTTLPDLFDTANILSLFTSIVECASDAESSFSNLLNIIQLLSVRHSQLDQFIDSEKIRLQLQRQSSSSSSSSEQADDSTDTGQHTELARRDHTSITVEEDNPNMEQGFPKSETPQQFAAKAGILNDLFSAFNTALLKWKERVGGVEERLLLPDVASKLLELAAVMLASGPLGDTVVEVTQFFAEPLTTLMAYSTEGYLSDCPHAFLVELLEFVCSLVEQGTPALTALQNNLPNLFGPAFGIRSHDVSCRLLEYGHLAVCSQHKKTLLTEALRFLMDVFHLFPPLDKIRAEELAGALHTEALHISTSIIEDLLSSLPVDAEGESALEEAQAERRMSPTEECESGPLEPVSDVEREMDRETRLKILLKLLQLACAMIRNGDNISFLYASILPKLFKQPLAETDTHTSISRKKLAKFFGEDPAPTANSIPWQVDKKRLALKLLELTILSVEHNVATPFQLCGIAVPKLVKNLDKMNLSDEEKLSLTLEVLKTTQEALEAGHSIDELISHGIDLLSSLLPPTASSKELRQFVNQMSRHFVTSSHTSLLFFIKNSCKFMTDSFPEEVEDVRNLFKTLIFRGKRDEIRGVFRVCKEPLKNDRFAKLRSYIYCYSSGKLSHRQLMALCELLVAAMDVEKVDQPKRAFSTIAAEEEEEEEGALLKERHAREMAAVRKLTSPCLQRVEAALESNTFRREVWESVSVELSHIALFRTLFQSEFASFSDFTQEQLKEAFNSKFPVEVLSDEAVMQLLALSALRMEHMQIPRFESLKKLLSSVIRHFLTLKLPATDEAAAATSSVQGTPQSSNTEHAGSCPIASSGEAVSALEGRKRELELYLKSLPRNAEDRVRLVECGYSSTLWEERAKVSLSVQTDGSYSLEENMRQTLLACYTEFADILKQMAITHVSVDGEMVKSAELFSEELSLTDLKGRRAVAVRVIDERLGRAQEGHFYEKRVALLAKEDEIETDFEKQASAPVRPHTFRVALNTSFFDCASCCGAQIIGCYAPTGEHCERPLEIGLRCDSAMASIYDESGTEIENAELLFTEEGAYMFKAYSNGHPYDTSQVWVEFLSALLRETAALAPAVIIPRGYPNQRTWDALRRCVATEITGSMLTCRHDFSPEWRSYFDHRPERVRLGTDMVLHPGFSLASAGSSHPLLRRQKSRLTKDLAGLIFEELMQKLLEDDWLKQFRFLGKAFSQYISVCVAEGVRKPAIVQEGFDYDRWKRTVTRMKTPPVVPDFLQQRPDHPSSFSSPQQPGSSTVDPSALPVKEAVVTHLLSFLDAGLVEWCVTADLTAMCCNSHKQFLELKRFLENAQDFQKLPVLKKQLVVVRELLVRCTRVVPVLSLPDSLQEEIIHWVFRNEDRVWRYRGGRDGHETLQQFMNFLGRKELRTTDSKVTQEGGNIDSDAPLEGGKIDAEVQQDSRREDVYAGVSVFLLPNLLDREADLDIDTLQVDQMVAYAVGEQMKPASARKVAGQEEEEGEGEEEEEGRWRGMGDSCYEVVTAWVHPRYRGLNLSVRMYLEIIKQVPERVVVCDMLAGSVERVIASHWLLRLLKRMRVSELILRRRQQSYTVVTQDGQSEQFEQVVLSTRPLRAALSVYSAARWIKTHLSIVSVATVAMVATPIVIGVVF